jgi:hypothetical protein
MSILQTLKVFMSPVKIFGLVIRICGLGLFIYSGFNLVFIIPALLRIPGTSANYGMQWNLLAFGFFLLSIYFLRGAPRLLKFCYPNESE